MENTCSKLYLNKRVRDKKLAKKIGDVITKIIQTGLSSGVGYADETRVQVNVCQQEYAYIKLSYKNFSMEFNKVEYIRYQLEPANGDIPPLDRILVRKENEREIIWAKVQVERWKRPVNKEVENDR